MTGTRARPPAGGASPSQEGPELTQQQAAEYIASMLEGLRLVAQNAQMPFLAYLINVALEEANNEKTTATEGFASSHLQGHKLLPMTLQPAREVELEQHDMDLPGRDLGRSDQLVDIDGARPQRTNDQLAFALANVGQGLGCPMLVGGGQLDWRRGRRTPQDRREHLEDVTGAGDEARRLA